MNFSQARLHKAADTVCDKTNQVGKLKHRILFAIPKTAVQLTFHSSCKFSREKHIDQLTLFIAE